MESPISFILWCFARMQITVRHIGGWKVFHTWSVRENGCVPHQKGNESNG